MVVNNLSSDAMVAKPNLNLHDIILSVMVIDHSLMQPFSIDEKNLAKMMLLMMIMMLMMMMVIKNGCTQHISLQGGSGL